MPIGAIKIYHFPKRPGHVGIEISDANSNRKIYLSTTSIPYLDHPESKEERITAALDPTKYQHHLGTDIGIFALNIRNPGKKQIYKLDKRVYTVTLPATENTIDFDDFINNHIGKLIPWDYHVLTNNCANFVALVLEKLGYHNNSDATKKYFLYPQDVYNSACKLPGATEEPLNITIDNIVNIFESKLSKLVTRDKPPEFVEYLQKIFQDCRKANNYSNLVERITSLYQHLYQSPKLNSLTPEQIEQIKSDEAIFVYLAELLNTWDPSAKTEVEPLDPHPTWKARIDMLTVCAIAMAAFIVG